jgi:hypothetical protein
MSRNATSLSLLILGVVLLGFCPAKAQEPTTATTRTKADISLDIITEEGQKMIRATVKSGGKPVENVTVAFGIRRSFGVLSLGEDKTLDDGSAAVQFPADLPGGVDGKLQVVAEIKAPPDYEASRTEAAIGGAKQVVANSDPLPRALWSTRAPYTLIVPVVLLLGGVWSAYAFVIAQILAIRRGARP